MIMSIDSNLLVLQRKQIFLFSFAFLYHYHFLSSLYNRNAELCNCQVANDLGAVGILMLIAP